MIGTLDEYRNAPNGLGPLGYIWSDKPHRLLYDLIAEIEHLREGLERIGRCCGNANFVANETLGYGRVAHPDEERLGTCALRFIPHQQLETCYHWKKA